ncbi:MAG: hypothetical protein AAGH60_01315 [Pseudomonadota bacterium]
MAGCRKVSREILRLIGLASALGFIAANSASAQLVTEPLVDDQYHVVETEAGVLRIDRQSGDVSECRNEQVGWVCRLSPDDRIAYEAEINRLDAEIVRLQSRVETAERQLAEQPFDMTDDEIASRLGLPTDQEVDVVMDTAEEVMRRFFGMVHRLRDDIQEPN